MLFFLFLSTPPCSLLSHLFVLSPSVPHNNFFPLLLLSSTSSSFHPSSGLYPNLEELSDYMGLCLNSDEVQRNMALVPVAENVSVWVHCGCFMYLRLGQCI